MEWVAALELGLCRGSARHTSSTCHPAHVHLGRYKHIEEILDQARGALDVSVLTHALQKTAEFEKEMHARFCSAEAVPHEEGGSPAAEQPPPKIIGSIAACFDSYMSIYISLEDKSIDETLKKLVGEESWSTASSGRADARVFDSSREFFIALKRSFKRGTALNMSGVLLDLTQV